MMTVSGAVVSVPAGPQTIVVLTTADLAELRRGGCVVRNGVYIYFD